MILIQQAYWNQFDSKHFAIAGKTGPDIPGQA